jgi:hypothetical protein
MPKAKRDAALYRRGQYWLDWDARADGTLRTPYLTIFWYDAARGRTRSASTRQTDPGLGKAALDARFLEETSGRKVCPSCHRPFDHTGALLVLDALTNYQVLHADQQDSADAIRARLAHILDYIEATDQADVSCAAVDERWISGFRKWAAKQPIVSPKGLERQRSLSTIENSVIQLAAAIRFAKLVPAFKSQPTGDLNNSPQHRSDVDELAAMFRYCVAPEGPWGAKERARRVRERAALHRFLIASVATWARPDAAYDLSTDPKRGQWNSKARVVSLNPKGRRQTKKRRATMPAPWQLALHLDAAPRAISSGRSPSAPRGTRWRPSSSSPARARPGPSSSAVR